ncbi:MAG: hypothetical protein R2708_28415 [Vicinamibacterales bacterium]
MRRVALLVLLSACAPPASLGAQTPAPAPTADVSPAALVRQWRDRLNALSDAPATLDAFVALYTPDALHIAGPTPDQRGTATYRGHAGIRVMAARLAAREVQRVYRLETETARETTASLIHETAGPWGGPAAAVQIIATYADPETKVRYAAPGAVFFQLDRGLIRRARVYIDHAERAEVEPVPTRKRP